MPVEDLQARARSQHSLLIVQLLGAGVVVQLCEGRVLAWAACQTSQTEQGTTHPALSRSGAC